MKPLKSCPFCGGTDIERKSEPAYFVECRTPGCNVFVMATTPEEAEFKWNRREK